MGAQLNGEPEDVVAQGAVEAACDVRGEPIAEQDREELLPTGQPARTRWRLFDEQWGEVGVCCQGVEQLLREELADLLPCPRGGSGVDLAEHSVGDGGDERRPVLEMPVERGGSGF